MVGARVRGGVGRPSDAAWPSQHAPLGQHAEVDGVFDGADNTIELRVLGSDGLLHRGRCPGKGVRARVSQSGRPPALPTPNPPWHLHGPTPKEEGCWRPRRGSQSGWRRRPRSPAKGPAMLLWRGGSRGGGGNEEGSWAMWWSAILLRSASDTRQPRASRAACRRADAPGWLELW